MTSSHIYRHRISRALTAVFCVAWLVPATAASASTGSTERVSIGRSGEQADGSSRGGHSVSGDGRYVAFTSLSSNLVPGDTNGVFDAFVHDRASGTTERVSVNDAGAQANAQSFVQSISADGRFVAFWSTADNLVASDTNGWSDVFVHDRLIHTTERVSVSTAGIQGEGHSAFASLSADGRSVAFDSGADNLVPDDTNGEDWGQDVFVRDRVSGTTKRISVSSAGIQGNRSSNFPQISADGRFVAFSSAASNLVPGDDNATEDVFVHHLASGTTERISVDASGSDANGSSGHVTDIAISDDGRFVAFPSLADDLVPSDTNGSADIFVRDRIAGVTQRVNVDSTGAQANGSGSETVALSGDGRYVAFGSPATNLVHGDTNGVADVFIHDRVGGATERVSLGPAGAEANDFSGFPDVNSDGRFVAFLSDASNLVPGDTNGVMDTFVRDRFADPDSDDDGISDGRELEIATDPLDADSDDDGISDGRELEIGTDPLDADSDDDGISDSDDPDIVAAAVAALPDSAFAARGHRRAMLARLNEIETLIAASDTETALAELRSLRTRVDGCSDSLPVADRNDWITDCAAQREVRARIDALIASLGG